MIFNASHAVLSMIFGFLSKFWIGEVKNILKENIFSRWKTFPKKSKKCFSRPKNLREKSYEKVNEKWKFRNFRKNRNFEIFIFHWFFHWFFFRMFFGLKKYFSIFDRKFFRPKFFRRKKFRPHISTQKISKIQKITLRKLSDETWSSIQPLLPFFSEINTEHPWNPVDLA